MAPQTAHTFSSQVMFPGYLRTRGLVRTLLTLWSQDYRGVKSFGVEVLKDVVWRLASGTKGGEYVIDQNNACMEGVCGPYRGVVWRLDDGRGSIGDYRR